MKKKYVVLLIAIATVIAILATSMAALAFSFVYYYYLDTDIYHLSPRVCGLFCGEDITPQEICETQGKGTCFEDNYVKAEVDSDGCLILTLNRMQIKRIKNDDNYSMQILQAVLGDDRNIGVIVNYSDDTYLGLLEKAPNAGLQISNDYTQAIVPPIEGNSPYMLFIPKACLQMQVFEGKNCKDFQFEYIYLNENGNVTQRMIYSEENGFQIVYE